MVRIASHLSVAFVLVLAACGESAPLIEKLAPPPAEEGFQLAMDVTAPPASEIWKCAVYRIPISKLATVNRVEYQQNAGMHHMTVSTPSLSGRKLPYGLHDCAELDGIMDLTMIFGSQGDPEGHLQLPPGVAATLPADIDIVHEVHVVNATSKPIEAFSRVNAYTIPQETVKLGIWGGQVRDEHLTIPPKSVHTEWTRCVMNEDIDVLFLASHTHQLGIDFTVARFDGKETGDVVYRNTDWHNPKIHQFDPPLSLARGTGFEYRCTWRNPSDSAVGYGLKSTEEMCNLAIVHTPLSQSARCEVVETSDGVLWKKSN